MLCHLILCSNVHRSLIHKSAVTCESLSLQRYQRDSAARQTRSVTVCLSNPSNCFWLWLQFIVVSVCGCSGDNTASWQWTDGRHRGTSEFSLSVGQHQRPTLSVHDAHSCNYFIDLYTNCFSLVFFLSLWVLASAVTGCRHSSRIYYIIHPFITRAHWVVILNQRCWQLCSTFLKSFNIPKNLYKYVICRLFSLTL